MDSWMNFLITGSVSDYILYKTMQNSISAANAADYTNKTNVEDDDENTHRGTYN